MNNETKHTAGEWTNTGLEIRHKNRGLILANVYAHLPANQPREEAEANARLIAAAPELLETLQRTFKRLEAFRNECLQEDSQEREIIIDIETDILDKIRKATRVS